jgi:transposase-like protein
MVSEKTSPGVPGDDEPEDQPAPEFVPRKRGGVPGNKGGYGVTKYEPEMDQTVFQLAREGLSIAQIAEELGVSRPTVDNWRKIHKSFCAALDMGRELVDDQVENALFKRALGYSHPDVHISNFQGEITVTPITKHYAPDTGAAKLWLTNRRPDKWRERTEVETRGSLTLEAGDSILGMLTRIRAGEVKNVTPLEAPNSQSQRASITKGED